MAETRASHGVEQSVGALVAELAIALHGLDDPVAESRELIAALLDAPRHWPVLHAQDALAPEVGDRARVAAARRAAGAPLAYAVGRAAFRSRTLAVDERVLIPRPETELLVELVLDWHRRRGGGVAVDVGTGSGAIAVALALEGAFHRVIATDLSLDALAVARVNAASLGARVEFLHGDLLAPLPAALRADIIVSNPPYIAHEESVALPRAVRDWEPATALFSAEQGMAATRRLARQAATRLAPGGLLAIEVDARRASLAAELVGSEPEMEGVTVKLDLAGRERFVLATRRMDEGGQTA